MKKNRNKIALQIIIICITISTAVYIKYRSDKIKNIENKLINSTLIEKNYIKDTGKYVAYIMSLTINKRVQVLKTLIKRGIGSVSIQRVLIFVDANTRIAFLHEFLPGKNYIDTSKNIKGTFKKSSISYNILLKKSGNVIKKTTWTITENKNFALKIQDGPLKGTYYDFQFIVVNDSLCIGKNKNGKYTFLITSKDPEKHLIHCNQIVKKLIFRAKSSGIVNTTKVINFYNNKKVILSFINDKMLNSEYYVGRAAKILPQFGMFTAPIIVQKYMNNALPYMSRRYALWLLYKMDYKKAAPFIVKVIMNNKTLIDLRRYSVVVLAELNPEPYIYVFKSMTYHRDTGMQEVALNALSKISNKKAKNIIRKIALHNKKVEIRKHAIFALSFNSNKNDLLILKRIAKFDKSTKVRGYAKYTIEQIKVKLKKK